MPARKTPPSAPRPRRKRRRKTPHDESYKRFFTCPEMIRDLILGFIPGPWHRELDLASLELVPKSFVSITSRQRHSDVIWRVRSKEQEQDRWLIVYLLLEFQSRPQKLMPARMMTLVGLLLELIGTLPAYRPAEVKLPPVLSVVLYNGQEEWTRPLSLAGVVDPLPPPLRGFDPQFRFLLIDEQRLSRERLAGMQNLVAALFRLESSSDPTAAAAGIDALNEQLEATGTPEVEEAFDLWLEQVVAVRFPELKVGAIRGREARTMLAESLDEWIDEAHRKGRQAGQTELVLSLLEERFAPLPKSTMRKVRALAVDGQLNELAKRVLVARSLEELGLR